MIVLGLIPARRGSKGVPGKHLRRLAGKPLIQHTIDAAQAATRLDRIVVTTDDPAIAKVAHRSGVDVLMRPEWLAQDDTPMLAVVQDALTWFACDAVCLLQPTVPTRETQDIDRCIAAFDGANVDSLITVQRVPSVYHPQWVYLPHRDGTISLASGRTAPISRRQDLPEAYHRDGSIYVTRADVVRAGSLYGNRTMGFVCDRAHVNIDTEADWQRAEDVVGTFEQLYKDEHTGPVVVHFANGRPNAVEVPTSKAMLMEAR